MLHDTATKKERWKDTTRLSDRDTCGEGVSFLPRCVLPTSLNCLGRVRIQPWGTSPCGCLGHGNKAYMPSNFLLSPQGSLCYSSYLLHLPPGALDASALTFDRGWLRWGKQKRSLAPAIAHAILGMRNLGRLNLASPGEDRGDTDWAAEGAICS